MTPGAGSISPQLRSAELSFKQDAEETPPRTRWSPESNVCRFLREASSPACCPGFEAPGLLPRQLADLAGAAWKHSLQDSTTC